LVFKFRKALLSESLLKDKSSKNTNESEVLALESITIRNIKLK